MSNGFDLDAAAVVSISFALVAPAAALASVFVALLPFPLLRFPLLRDPLPLVQLEPRPLLDRGPRASQLRRGGALPRRVRGAPRGPGRQPLLQALAARRLEPRLERVTLAGPDEAAFALSVLLLAGSVLEVLVVVFLFAKATTPPAAAASAGSSPSGAGDGDSVPLGRDRPDLRLEEEPHRRERRAVRVSAEQASKPLQVPVGQQIELFRAFLGDEVLLLARRAAAGAGAEGRDPGVWRGASRAGRRRRRRLLLLLQEQQQLLPLSALLLLLERG